MSPRSLTSRPLDLLYFIFFAIHIPNTLLIDLQPLYPQWLLPDVIKQLPGLYLNLSNDPLIGGAFGFFGKTDDFIWFKTFLLLEAIFQLPTFILGMRALWNDSRSIYVLLLAYAASTATTTLPCIAVIWNTPLTSPETIAANVVSVTSAQKTLLLSSYFPFFFIPFIMAVDMAIRVSRLARAGAAAQRTLKTK